MHNREIDEEESNQDLLLELVSQADGDRNGGNTTTQGSKVQHGSRGKQQRERRKMREKRRSTGVVRLENTESTGGSTAGEEEGKDEMGGETKKNTKQNEIMGKDSEYITLLYLPLTGSSHNRPNTRYPFSTRKKP